MSDYNGFGFAVGSVFGFRSFEVDRLGRLVSPQQPNIWTPGENVAECKARHGLSAGWPVSIFQYISDGNPANADVKLLPPPEPPKHECEGIGDACKMGFYAYWGEQYSDYACSSTLEGIVEAYGKVVIGSLGFRAEKARIVALTVPYREGTVDYQHTYLKDKHMTTIQVRRLPTLYPDVKFYNTTDEMLAAHPPTSTEVDPSSDADFWTREA